MIRCTSSPQIHHRLDYIVDRRAPNREPASRDELKNEVLKYSYHIKDNIIHRQAIDFTHLAIIAIDELALYESKHDSNLRLVLGSYSDNQRMWIKRLILQAQHDPTGMSSEEVTLLKHISDKLFHDLAKTLPVDIEGYDFKINYPDFG